MFHYWEPDIIGHSADVIFTPEDRAMGAADAEAPCGDCTQPRSGGAPVFARGIGQPSELSQAD
jgi:hypothetical protein